MKRPRPALLVLVTSLCVAAGASVAAFTDQGTNASPVASVGARPSGTPIDTSDPTASPTTPSALPESPRPAKKPTPTPTREPAPLAPTPMVRPAGLEVPSLGIKVTVRATGVDTQGRTEIPDDPAVAGWYRLGVVPGAPSGSAVMVGHRDSAKYGIGQFSRLDKAQLGDAVNVRRTDGRVLRYRVVARTSYAKLSLPVGEIFRAAGPPVLTLITCGGDYARGAGGWSDNVVVTAVPVDSTPGTTDTSSAAAPATAAPTGTPTGRESS